MPVCMLTCYLSNFLNSLLQSRGSVPEGQLDFPFLAILYSTHLRVSSKVPFGSGFFQGNDMPDILALMVRMKADVTKPDSISA